MPDPGSQVSLLRTQAGARQPGQLGARGQLAPADGQLGVKGQQQVQRDRQQRHAGSDGHL